MLGHSLTSIVCVSSPIKVIKIAHRKDTVTHAKEHKLEPHEIKQLMSQLTGSDKFIFTALLYGGLRVGELTHLRSNWVHIDDNYSEAFGYDYIQIPIKGQVCDCDQCLLNAYIEHVRDEHKKSKAWYKQTMSDFFNLKRLNRLPISEGIWRPKTKNSNRKIPILMDEFKYELLHFFKNHDELGMIRQQVGQIVKQRSLKYLHRHLYPHAIRATTASLWVDSGANVQELMKIMGWETMNTAQIYINASDKQAFKHLSKRSSAFEEMIK